MASGLLHLHRATPLTPLPQIDRHICQSGFASSCGTVVAHAWLLRRRYNSCLAQRGLPGGDNFQMFAQVASLAPHSDANEVMDVQSVGPQLMFPGADDTVQRPRELSAVIILNREWSLSNLDVHRKCCEDAAYESTRLNESPVMRACV